VWYDPPKYKTEIKDVNKLFMDLKGELEMKEARITLAKFLFRNLGLTTDLLTGVKLYPDQIINIKGMMNSNFTLCVWGRGLGKTYTAAIFCILQCIFFPNSNILIAGPTFRTARFIFNNIEKICDSPEAQLLFQAMGVKSKRNDEFRWRINGGEIVAIPLNGEKIRGFRANILIIDEFLLMNEELVEKVLMPFLLAPQDIKERQIIREKENELIRRGVLKEEERMVFENKAKLIALSSASYTCEFLYKKYDEFVKQIYSPTVSEDGAKYFVSQMAWDSIPLDRVDKNIIKQAQSNESNAATFKREYGAQFIDGSDSYFSMNKMIACTIPDGESPSILMKGKKEGRYILSIDPNFSNSPTADNFAMCVIEVDEEAFSQGKASGTVVHNYAKHGMDLREHIRYLHYLMTNFNIELIIIDYAGYQFLEAANESEWFKKDQIEIKVFEFYAEKDGEELTEQLKQARKNLNKEIKRIAFTQYFTSDFIRKGNEWLQGSIDYKKIWFGSNINANEGTFDKTIKIDFDLEATGEESLGDLIDSQELLMKQTKYECASIEVKSTAKGTQSFDLPQIMKRDTTATRMRRDSYTALMLGCWALKQYFDITNLPKDDTSETFQPILL
jgi:Terminase large subunit, T4likevirus-type, N-terminal